MSRGTTLQLAVAERRDFADLLDHLAPDQWEQPTLCAGWKVRDVVAHVLSYEELDTRETVRRFVRGGFVPDRVNAIGVVEYGGKPPTELAHLMHASIYPRGVTAGFGGVIALVDGMIHQQDIRRPLGIGRSIPAPRLTAVLNAARFVPPVRGVWRARGLRLSATDVDWAFGSGPAVCGPGEALLMAMAARPVALEDLDGPGVPALAERITS